MIVLTRKNNRGQIESVWVSPAYICGFWPSPRAEGGTELVVVGLDPPPLHVLEDVEIVVNLLNEARS